MSDLGRPHCTVENVKQVTIEQKNKGKALQEGLFMACCVYHVLSIYSLIAAYLSRRAIILFASVNSN